MSLHQQINALAADFAHSLLKLVRGASLEEILHESHVGHSAHAGGHEGHAHVVHHAPARKGRGRLRRRSDEAIQGMVDRIVGLLRSNPKGLRAEDIREKLGIQRRELPRPLADAVRKRLVSKHGQKRATTYFAGGHAAKPAKPARKARPSRSKKGKK